MSHDPIGPGRIIQLRRDTEANWAIDNPTLALGETGWTEDTRRVKLGDGVTAWNDLPYAADEAASVEVEKDRAEAAEAVLQDAIDAEAQARADADADLQQAIDEERTRATDAENALDERLDTAENALTGRLSDASLSAEYSPLLTYPVSTYGATGDGITDDSAAVNAAAAAAQAAGGGLVLLDHFAPTYLLDHPVVIPRSVGLIGVSSAGSGILTSPAQKSPTFKLNSATASVVIGDGIVGPGTGISKCWSVGGFDIDGNSTGDPLGALRIDAVNSTDFRNIAIKNAGGHGIRIACGQNSNFDNVLVFNSGRVATADDWHITGGAGGNLFSRCYGSGASGAFLSFTKDVGVPDVYTSGPSHNKFDHCIFETSVSITHETGVRYKNAGNTVFSDCLFVGTNPTVGWLIDFPSGGSGVATFINCNFVCSGDIFGYRGDFVVEARGPSLFLASAGTGGGGLPGNVLNTTVATTRFNMSQVTGTYLIAGKVLACSGAGSLAHYTNTVDRISGDRFLTSATEPGVTIPFLSSVEGDTQPRFYYNYKGDMAWGAGGSTFPDKSLSRDTTYGMHLHGGLRTTGRVSKSSAAYVFGGGTATYTIDSSAHKYHRFEFTAGGNATFDISNPVDGTELVLQIGVDTVAMSSVTWPSNIYWHMGQPPTLPKVSMTTITLVYDAALNAGAGAWLEVGRRINGTTAVLPASPGAWIAATVLNGSNVGSGYAPARYQRDSNGMVIVQGLVGGVTIGGSAIIVLPAGYRPGSSLRFPIGCYNGAAAVAGYANVDSSGNLWCPAGAGTQLSLSGIQFPAEA